MVIFAMHKRFQIWGHLFLSGNYSCLLAELHLKRSLGFHMVQSYLPTILIVVISWVSFWMDVDSVAGRTTLGVTTLLTVSSKASGAYKRTKWTSKRNTKKVSHLNLVFNLYSRRASWSPPSLLREGRKRKLSWYYLTFLILQMYKNAGLFGSTMSCQVQCNYI